MAKKSLQLHIFFPCQIRLDADKRNEEVAS